MVDRSFGFETAVQECTNAINSALVEAMSCEYGVGIVKLMGREAGFIAAYATLASHDVDLCLIPEVDVDLYDDQYGILPYIRRCLERQHHCVVVTSETTSAYILTSFQATVLSAVILSDTPAMVALPILSTVRLLREV